MGVVMDLIRNEWYPAWDSGDPERFDAVSRRIFAPDATLCPPGVDPTPVSLAEVLPRWLEELETWKPQVHEIIHEVEQGNKAAWEYRWHATHARPIVRGGREIPATNRVFRNAAVAIGYANDEGRLVHLRGASNFHDIIRELEGHKLEPLFA